MTKKKVRSITAGQRRAQQRRQTFPRPGVIQEIVHVLEVARDKNKPVTVEDILKQLTRKFPDRDEAGMAITVRAQLSRLPKERGIGIEKEQGIGRIMKYYAA